MKYDVTFETEGAGLAFSPMEKIGDDLIKKKKKKCLKGTADPRSQDHKVKPHSHFHVYIN